MKIEDITPLVLTFNEAPNLARTLARLTWARSVLVIDSGSTDSTLSIAAQFPNVRFEVRAFDSHTIQWNFGIDATQTEWVLALDADYVLGEGFEDEMQQLDGTADAYDAGFCYLIFGQPLRGSLYPRRAVLFAKSRCRYVQDGHTQLLSVSGLIGHMRTMIHHDDRKSLSRWLVSQDKYANLEVEKLMNAHKTKLRLQDKLRLTCWASVPASLVYTLLIKGTFWDGWRGWYYALQRMLAEMLLTMRLIEKKFKYNE